MRTVDYGDFYPIRSVLVNSGSRYRAEFCGVRRECGDRELHNEDLRRMKRAEMIADQIYDARRRSGCSVWIDPFDCAKHVEGPDNGYVVSLRGYETRMNFEPLCYSLVFADVVEKLELLELFGNADDTVCIGSWEHGGELYIDISVHVTDRDDAVNRAKATDQLCIYDIADGRAVMV